MQPRSRVLICAATGVEARACRLGVRGGAPGVLFEVLQTGVGPESAERSLKTRLASRRHRPQLIVSSGFAGCLTDRLHVGEWALAGGLLAQQGHFARVLPLLRGALLASPLRWQTAVFITADRVISRGDHAPPPGSEAADVIDMETWPLYQVAAGARIQFQALRMITDTPDRPIPRAFGAWATSQGPLGLLRGLRHAALQPLATSQFVVSASRFPRQLSEGLRELVARWSEVSAGV